MTWAPPCEGCIFFHPERDRRKCGILSGGTCVETERCSVRIEAPEGIRAQREAAWRQRVMEEERRDAELRE